ncbi:MAG TPA: hypothetical protein VHQ90_09110 [Thermoanaerobaculia bacterium]|nr:hypothetical protein [Thermoanaerobaculia bacterium]
MKDSSHLECAGGPPNGDIAGARQDRPPLSAAIRADRRHPR